MLFKIYLIEQLKAFVIILACFFKQLFAILPRLFLRTSVLQISYTVK